MFVFYNRLWNLSRDTAQRWFIFNSKAQWAKQQLNKCLLNCIEWLWAHHVFKSLENVFTKRKAFSFTLNRGNRNEWQGIILQQKVSRKAWNCPANKMVKLARKIFFFSFYKKSRWDGSFNFLSRRGKRAAVMAFLVKVMLAEGRILQWGSLSTAKKGSVTDALWDFLCFPQN